MILEQVRVKNFRQYYGTQTIRFSKDKDKNVTVIHGDNGTGKTTFLNMLLWGLYGKINLPKPEAIYSEKTEAEALDGSEIEVFVEIRFRDGARDYTVFRILKGKKHNGKIVIGNPSLVVSIIDERGRTINPGNPQNTIDEIMPKDMSAYFFFDGERIDNLSKESSAADIKEAIKTIMGLKVLERAQDHLDDVRKQFAEEIKASKNENLAKLISDYEEEEKNLVNLKERMAQNSRNRRAAVQHKEEIEAKLREAEETRLLQGERDKLENSLSEVQKAISYIDQNVKSLCSKRGYLAFSQSILENIQAILAEKREKGEIPAGIKQQFVQDLLERRLCICGMELIQGTEHYKNVAAWLDQAGSKELEDKFTQMTAGVNVMIQYREDLYDQLKRFREDRDKQVSRQENIKEQLDEISSKLKDKESEEVRGLEIQRQVLDDKIRDCDVKAGEYNIELKRTENNLKNIQDDIKKNEAAEAKTALAKRRMEACQEAAFIIQRIHEGAAIKTKTNLQKRINEVYTHFLRKGYVAKLNEDYTLQIIKEFGETEKGVAMSQGERQITSLAFIGSLVDIAREQQEKGRSKFFRGGIYPIIMDSPFGSLDPDHRARIAQGIPTLSHQVVVLVTDSQWEGDVKNHIGGRIGAEYTLVNHNPISQEPSQYEYTEIREV